ncbi:hypothetical protein Ahy_A02g006061 isoform C [Arachis hypogaea]|uniref:Uncharacterized protein n=1 Tax=Arachis hypogaea TaxID=3818 RepID=A0A445E8R2_ARAHY|nr:hypothetical protein Ahy_A02g006061 isoform C [Arachis hypogaea]
MLCRIWYPPSSKRNPSHPPKAAPAGGPVAVAVAAWQLLFIAVSDPAAAVTALWPASMIVPAIHHNQMEHAKDDFDVNDYSEEDEKEQLRKTKVDGVMVSWNNLRYKCPESGRGTREETASKKLQHKANNSDFFF